ncbi:SDR family oxidoreductase [Neorhizobium sp. T25_13]|uniref:SDR family oxidoreductase n=1 Tax=Neorhizobium sp. T25_13 TaxID=2093830 RepID=UPI0027393E31|nr:SDR family oxidoreductase [Neorhizobium sp. T25_13]
MRLWKGFPNRVAYGHDAFARLAGRTDEAADPEEMRRSVISRQAIGRLGAVKEMAAAAVFLSSDEAAFMTGQILVIDGGQTL